MASKFLVAVSVVIERDGLVLVLRRSSWKDHAPGEWEPVSGHVEPGEAPSDAARREAKEETGLDVEIVAPFYTFHFYRGPSCEETIGITFYGVCVGGELTLSPEHDEARWIALEDLSESPVMPAVRSCFEIFMKVRDRLKSC
jgi:8-oxo-dGTP diphosphatase